MHRSPFVFSPARGLADGEKVSFAWEFTPSTTSWSPSPSKRWRLTSVRQRSILHHSKDALRRLTVSFAQGQSLSLACGEPAPFTQGSLIFVHERPLILSSKSSLSDGKDNNEQCTRVSLHLLEGEGDRAPTAHGGRGKYGSQTYSYAAREVPLG